MKINASTLALAAALAGAIMTTGCRTSQDGNGKLTLLSDRGCIPAPLDAPAKGQESQSELVGPAGTPAFSTAEQPPLPKGTELPSSEDEPVFVDEKGNPAETAAKDDKADKKDAKDDKAEAKAESKAPRTYKVVKGDSLSIIAYRFKVSMKELAKLNNLTEKSILHVDQVLTLPEKALEKPRPRPQRRPGAKKAEPTSEQTKVKGEPIPADGIYVTQAGDSLWKIAFKYKLSMDDIKAANPDIDFDKLQQNVKVKLPKGAAQQPAKKSAAPKATPAAQPATETPANQPAPKEPTFPFQEPADAPATEATPAPAANEPPVPPTVNADAAAPSNNEPQPPPLP